MKYCYLILFICCFSARLSAQGSIELSAEERAYLYHIVKKSPILDQNIGRYFEYKGPMVRFMNKEVNFDSIETIIINNPEQLFIRTSEIGKSPKGIIAEAANKMALWELNKVLLASRQSDKELERFALQYSRFETILTPKLPPAAFKGSNPGEEKINKKLLNVLNPSLSFEDKAAMLATFNFLSTDDQLTTINALNDAVNAYVEERSFEIFKALGGVADQFHNVLVAAGDGSETSGLLNEREKDENGRWNKGLPKAVGFFPYQVKLIVPEKRKKTALETLRFSTTDFTTAGEGKLTQLHFDVWGYNSEKQTTVVVERNRLSYHLFGSDETRFLTPDSAFTKGKTFQTVINDLEFNKIGDLKEKIYGKKGFDYQIETAKKKKDDTELKIEKNEKEYSDMTRSPITTSSKAPRSVKKARKKAIKNGTVTDQKHQPKTDSGKPKRGKGQSEIVDLYNEFEFYAKKIKDLEREKQEAVDLMALYQRRLDQYKEMMGFHWATYTEKDGLYTFQDSTTFDILTQEFTFRADTLKTPFEVRLLAIPYGSLSDEADEVMLHVNLIDAEPGFDARLQLELSDAFAPNSWTLNQPLFSQNDSVAVRQLFEGLLDKKTPITAVSRGQGVGSWNGLQTVRAADRGEMSSYPGATSEEQQINRMNPEWARLRCSQVSVTLNRGIFLEINTFTDPVKTNLKATNSSVADAISRYKLTGNDYLSALRTATIIQKMKSELNVLAGTYLSREEAKIAIDRLNKSLDGLRVSCGATSWKWQELLEQ
jgi:hypothetical protein